MKTQANGANEADRLTALRGAQIGRVDESREQTRPEEQGAVGTSGSTIPAATDQHNTPAAQQNTPSATTTTTTPATPTENKSQTSTSRQARRLPRTASDLGLFELLSGLSLAGAIGVGRLRKHVVEKA